MYNDSAFIDTALLSVARQSHTDFEVIISDDYSKDDSLKRADGWVKRDHRFRMIRNRKNIGMTRNWNLALAAARGQYVIKLDADDVMRPNCLEVLVNELEQNQSVYAAACRTLSCDHNLEPLRPYKGDEAFMLKDMNPQKRYVLSGHEWYAICFNDIQLWHSNAMMHRTEKLLRLGGWNNAYGCAADTDLILRVLETGNRVCHHPYVGIFYRHRDQSVSATYRKQGWLHWEDAILHLTSLNRYYENKNRLSGALRKAWWHYWQRWRLLKKKRLNQLWDIPEPYKQKIAILYQDISPPPLFILAEGKIREKVWFIRQKIGEPFKTENVSPTFAFIMTDAKKWFSQR